MRNILHICETQKNVIRQLDAEQIKETIISMIKMRRRGALHYKLYKKKKIQNIYVSLATSLHLPQPPRDMCWSIARQLFCDIVIL